MPKALVTGANGFIGSHLVRELLRRGYEVNCLVRSTSDLASLRGLPVTLFIGDVREPDTLAAPMKDVDYIYHLAAQLMATSREMFENTIAGGTRNMLSVAEKHAAGRLKRFLYVSSQSAAGPGTDATPVDETVQHEPISWYGYSKKHAEEAVHSFADRLPVTIVRPSAVYGERETDISQTYPVVACRLQPKLGLEPKYVVMVYVGDLVQGFVEAAESESTLKQTYALNHSEVLTTKDVIQTVARALGKPRGLLFPVPVLLIRLAAPFAELLHHFNRLRAKITRDKAREISQNFWVSDPAKAKRDFGWEAKHDLLQGMEPTLKWFFDRQKMIREMPLEKSFMLWLKFVVLGLVLGAVVEVVSEWNHFYVFDPPSAVFVSVIVWFGVVLGSIAVWLRRRGNLFQFAAGTLVMGLAEVLNGHHLIPGMSWTFAPGWPLGITNLWLHSLVLGFVGGFAVLIDGIFMRLLYKRRLRLG